MPIRVFEIAQKLGVENKVVLAMAKVLRIQQARVASSSLDKITAEYLEQEIRKSPPMVSRRPPEPAGAPLKPSLTPRLPAVTTQPTGSATVASPVRSTAQSGLDSNEAKSNTMKVEFEKMVAAGKIRKDVVPLLTALTRTGFVTHRSWGFGRIRKVDTVFSRLVVDFRDRPGHAFDLGFAAQILKPSTEDGQAATTALQIENLNWKLLPPGELNVSSIRRYLDSTRVSTQRRPDLDPSRFEFLLTLSPSHVYAGLDEFDGYLAFLFPRFSGAVLENPIEGNALYVFDSNWRMLSKRTKSDLFAHGSTGVHRLVHTGNWQYRLRTIIGC